MKESDAPSVPDLPVSSSWLVWLASTSVGGAIIAAVSLGLDTAARGALGQWVYIAGLGAALTSITAVAFSAQSRRQAIARAKRHAHELEMRRATYGRVELAPEEMEEAAADLVLLEDVHAFEHANILRAALELETYSPPTIAPATTFQVQPAATVPRYGRTVPSPSEFDQPRVADPGPEDASPKPEDAPE